MRTCQIKAKHQRIVSCLLAPTKFCRKSEQIFGSQPVVVKSGSLLSVVSRVDGLQRRPFSLMGNLPESQIDVLTKAFHDSGTDFGCPFAFEGTHKESMKAYLALFVGFVSRAKHLEAVSDLKTQACIAASLPGDDAQL